MTDIPNKLTFFYRNNKTFFTGKKKTPFRRKAFDKQENEF